MTEPCKYDPLIKDMRDDIKEILRIIKGDNGEGLMTKVRVAWTHIKIQYSLITLLVAGLITLAFWKLR